MPNRSTLLSVVGLSLVFLFVLVGQSDCPPVTQESACGDGIDNDHDGLVDCQDREDCCGSAACAGSADCLLPSSCTWDNNWMYCFDGTCEDWCLEIGRTCVESGRDSDDNCEAPEPASCDEYMADGCCRCE